MKLFQKLRILGLIAIMLVIVASDKMLLQANGSRMLKATTSENATTLDTKDSIEIIDNKDRENAYILLIEYRKSLETLYELSDATKEKIDDIFYEANTYIANTDMTVGALKSYVTEMEGKMSTATGGANVVTKTSDFLFLVNETPASQAVYNQAIDINLSLINLGKDDITDIVITPNVSTKPTEWPFNIGNSSDVRMIKGLNKASSLEEAYANRQNVKYTFVVSDEALTGTYSLSFHVQYYRNGNIESTDLKSYVNVTGKPGNGELVTSESDSTKDSTPRIIVTGFKTEPEKVYAGDTFKLTITVQNTSSETAVSNIQFDLKAAVEGSEAETTYEAFLPTSGSATIYVPSIGMGCSTDLTMEMTAKSDLVQKPYVVTINAAYEDADNNPFTATTNVSVPVYQAARVDTGDAEVMPEVVEIGKSSNVTFDIYNMGKTTLYNVKISFDNNDDVSGGNGFIGKIESGATGTVDVNVNADNVSMDDKVIATISYEDDAGNETSFEKEIGLTVIEPQEDFADYDYDEEVVVEENSFPVLPVIIVAVVVIVIIIVIIVAKKKKKTQKLLLDDLDNDDDDEDLL